MHYLTLIREIQDVKGRREGIKPSLLVVLYYFSLTINSFSRCATLPSRKFRRGRGGGKGQQKFRRGRGGGKGQQQF